MVEGPVDKEGILTVDMDIKNVRNFWQSNELNNAHRIDTQVSTQSFWDILCDEYPAKSDSLNSIVKDLYSPFTVVVV